MESVVLWSFIIPLCFSLVTFLLISKRKIQRNISLVLIFSIIIILGVLPIFFMYNIVHPMPEYGECIPEHMGKYGTQCYPPETFEDRDEFYREVYDEETEWREGLKQGIYLSWYIALAFATLIFVFLQKSLRLKIEREPTLILNQKRKTKILAGILSFIFGWLLFISSFLTQDVFLFILSFLLISVGFWFILSRVNKKIAYFVMGLLNGISAPLYVYLSILVFNFNYIAMDFLLISLILGVTGVVIGVIGIFIQIKSLKLKENVFVVNALIVSQIVMWVFSFIFGICTPSWVIY